MHIQVQQTLMPIAGLIGCYRGGVTGFLRVMGIQTVYDWAICWAGRTGLSLGIGSPDPV